MPRDSINACVGISPAWNGPIDPYGICGMRWLNVFPLGSGLGIAGPPLGARMVARTAPWGLDAEVGYCHKQCRKNIFVIVHWT